MQKADVECRECGTTNHGQADRCRSCSSRLIALDPTLQSGRALATTTPSGNELTEPTAGELDVTEISGADTTAPPLPMRWDHKLVGTMVGEYKVTRVIGEGGMGTVFAGTQPLIGKEVAIKVLKASLSGDSDVVERFLAEAKAVNTIRHPNIIDIFSFGILEDESQYFVMEYMDGKSLATYLEEVTIVGYSDALEILTQVLDALKAAHDHGVVHRDLKPDNIYLGDHPSGGFHVKLLDFGIAKFTEDGISSGHTQTGVPIGTPKYMSPEQCYGRDVDHQSDLYSLGVIMYQMFTGQPPFSAKSVYQLVDSHVHTPPVKPSTLVDFPVDLEALILWCLEKDKASRPQTVSELQDRLLPILERRAGRDTVAPPPMPALPDEPAEPAEPGLDSRLSAASGERIRANREKPRGRTGLYLVMGGLIAVVAVVAVLLMRSPKERTTAQGAPPPPAVMATPDASPGPKKPDLVALQFQVSPQGVLHAIYVNDTLVKGKIHEVPRHRTRPIRVKIVAAGYHTYEAEWVPFSNLPIQVTLVKKDLPKPMPPVMRPRWRPMRHRPPAMHDTRPRPRPTMGGFDML